MSRLIVLDTETTGLEVSEGHRIIEIGAVEMVERRLTGNNYHQYICPDRAVDPGALEVHGLSNEFLQDKPRFPEIANDFMTYLEGADELVIHNAAFDVEFIDNELELAGLQGSIDSTFTVIDSLAEARKIFPGKRNSLDALCDRFEINNAHRTLHGALLDSEILADVYLRMTGGQETLAFDDSAKGKKKGLSAPARRVTGPLPVVVSTAEERAAHLALCQKLGLVEEAGNGC